jgi:hypothetical protein
MAMPGTSIDDAIEVESVGDEYGWLELHPCPCGGGWQLVRQSLLRRERGEAGDRVTDRLEVRCDTCGREAAFFFVVQYEGPVAGVR